MDLADLFVEVLPAVDRFGPELDRKLSTIAPRSGAKAGQDLGKKVETEASRNVSGKFLTNNSSLSRAAGTTGLKIGRNLATQVAKQMTGTITSRAGKALGDKLYTAASAKFKDSRWANGLKNPKVLAVAGAAGLLIGKKIMDRVNGETSKSFKMGGLSSGMGGLGGRAGSVFSKGFRGGIVGLPGIIAGIVGGGIVAGAKALANKASDLNETVSKTKNIFGSATGSIEAWAKDSAQNLGLANQAALEGAASFGNLFDQIGIGQQQSVKMSKGFLQMAADAASFSNADPSEVMDAFLSATRGEYDALQRFVPTASAATIQAEALRLSHKKSTNDLTAADNATALYAVSVRDLGKAHGDFSRTSSGFANQQRILAANWANLQVKIGQYFLPAFTKAAQYMNTQGFPALTRIVGVLGDGATAAGRMAQAVLSVFSNRLGNEIDSTTLSLGEIADWLETHQEKMVRFFVNIGDAVLDLGLAITHMVSGGIRGFGRLATGLATFLDGAIPGLQGLLDATGIFLALIPGMGKQAGQLRQSSRLLGEAGQSAAAGLRNTAREATGAAETIDQKMNPIFSEARKRLHAVGDEEIWKAKQRDAAARATQAIKGISTAADHSEIRLHHWNDRTELSSKAQRDLADRLRTARARMIDQYVTGVKAGTQQSLLTKRWNAGRDALYREFRQMGLSAGEAKKLADRYGKIPTKQRTVIEQPGMQSAQAHLDALHRQVGNLQNKTVSIKYRVTAGGTEVHFPNSGIYAKAMASGGPVNGGAGQKGRRADRIPAALSDGEYVHQAETRSFYGDKVMDDINHRRIPREVLVRHFADGGPVNRRITQRTLLPPAAPAVVSRLLSGTQSAIQAGVASGVKSAMASAGKGVGAGAVANAGGLTSFNGGTFTRLAAANLRIAQRNAHQRINVYQGGFRPSTSYSGTSHRGDALDSQPSPAVIKALRGLPWASGDRTGLGNWMSHAHSVPSPTTGHAAGSAVWQYQDYVRRGGARQSLHSPWGLAGGGTFKRNGVAIVGEREPEMLFGHKGDTVAPLSTVAKTKRPITIVLDLGDGFRQRVEGILDENEEFHAGLGRFNG
jgi:hypothetical protein